MDIWKQKFKIQYHLQSLKDMKYFNVNLMKHVHKLCAENYNILMKKIKKYLNKWR